MTLFGFPVFGVILPYVGRRVIALNSDGSQVDTGEYDICNEVGPYYVKPWVLEWLGLGFGLDTSSVYETKTGQIVNPPWKDEPAKPFSGRPLAGD